MRRSDTLCAARCYNGRTPAAPSTSGTGTKAGGGIATRLCCISEDGKRDNVVKVSISTALFDKTITRLLPHSEVYGIQFTIYISTTTQPCGCCLSHTHVHCTGMRSRLNQKQGYLCRNRPKVDARVVGVFLPLQSLRLIRCRLRAME